MVDRSIKKPFGVLYDVLVKVGHFIFSIDFVILDCEIDHEIFSILGRPMAVDWAMIDIECGEIKFCVDNEKESLNVCKSLKQPMDQQVVFVIDMINDEVVKAIKIDYVSDLLVGILLNLINKEVE